jgi:ribosomal protein L24E
MSVGVSFINDGRELTVTQNKCFRPYLLADRIPRDVAPMKDINLHRVVKSEWSYHEAPEEPFLQP